MDWVRSEWIEVGVNGMMLECIDLVRIEWIVVRSEWFGSEVSGLELVVIELDQE